MLLRFILLCTLLAAFACAQPIVIKRVTVIDATGKPAQRDMTVVIAGDSIAAVSKKAKVPKNAQVVDGAGKFLIPGLWDMHVHGATDAHSSWTHPLFLANGVVGVRDMWGPRDANAWRARRSSAVKPA